MAAHRAPVRGKTGSGDSGIAGAKAAGRRTSRGHQYRPAGECEQIPVCSRARCGVHLGGAGCRTPDSVLAPLRLRMAPSDAHGPSTRRAELPRKSVDSRAKVLSRQIFRARKSPVWVSLRPRQHQNHGARPTGTSRCCSVQPRAPRHGPHLIVASGRACSLLWGKHPAGHCPRHWPLSCLPALTAVVARLPALTTACRVSAAARGSGRRLQQGAEGHRKQEEQEEGRRGRGRRPGIRQAPTRPDCVCPRAED